MTFSELVVERYSLRRFSDRPVEKEKLTAVLEAGRRAPTAHNNQPQRFFVIQSETAKAQLDSCIFCHMVAPVYLVVAYNPTVAWDRENDGKNHGEIDATIAATQMMLQAADLGLGTTYIGMFAPDRLVQTFPEMAGLTPTAVLPLGYPAGDAHPSRVHPDRRPLDELTRYL